MMDKPITDDTRAHAEGEEAPSPTAGQEGLERYVNGIFEAFKSARRPWEEIWEECWNNYIGQYQPNLNWRKETEGTEGRSQIFIKLTNLKCNTAHSKIVDVLFAGHGEVPFSVLPCNHASLGIPPDVAEENAASREDRIKERFRAIDFEETLDAGILEMAILGTSVLKGPTIAGIKKQRVVPRTIGGLPASEIDAGIQPFEIQSYDEDIAVIDHVPLWEYYVDPNALSAADSIAEIHFQRLLPERFRQYASGGGFIADNVAEAVRRATDADDSDTRYIQLGDNYTGVQGEKDKRVSVLEFWGTVPASKLHDVGCELPEGTQDDAGIEALVVLAADGLLVKACINPLGFRPFNVCPYKRRPHTIYGIGVAEMMRDSQKFINSTARLIVDNKALSGNGMVAINLDRINTKRTKNMKAYPGKTWYVKGNFAPKDAIDSIAFKDVTAGLRELMEMMMRFADEETGIPKYTHGEQDSFLNKTATGMSMLMSQANINLKTVMKNVDNYLIEPIVERFDSVLELLDGTGGPALPITIKALGSDSLIAKELKMENYMKFMQITSDPKDAIFMDRVKMMKSIARILEIEDVMRSDDEIKQVMDEMANAANAQKDTREMVDLDRLYPLLARSEQMQILMQLGIEPDQNFAPPVPGQPQVMGPPAEGGAMAPLMA